MTDPGNNGRILVWSWCHGASQGWCNTSYWRGNDESRKFSAPFASTCPRRPWSTSPVLPLRTWWHVCCRWRDCSGPRSPAAGGPAAAEWPTAWTEGAKRYALRRTGGTAVRRAPPRGGRWTGCSRSRARSGRSCTSSATSGTGRSWCRWCAPAESCGRGRTPSACRWCGVRGRSAPFAGSGSQAWVGREQPWLQEGPLARAFQRLMGRFRHHNGREWTSNWEHWILKKGGFPQLMSTASRWNTWHRDPIQKEKYTSETAKPWIYIIKGPGAANTAVLNPPTFLYTSLQKFQTSLYFWCGTFLQISWRPLKCSPWKCV